MLELWNCEPELWNCEPELWNCEPRRGGVSFYLTRKKKGESALKLTQNNKIDVVISAFTLTVPTVPTVLELWGTVEPYQKRQRENKILSALVGSLFSLYFSHSSKIVYIGWNYGTVRVNPRTVRVNFLELWNREPERNLS